MDTEKKVTCYGEAAALMRAHFATTPDLTARMATMAAVLNDKFDHFFWTGFYVLIDGELTVGPYEGPLACAVLPEHTGVCWAGIDRRESIVVPNVHEFPGHIECDARSNSEIVVPLRNRTGEIIGVLDIDSGDFDAFDEVDVQHLERIVAMLWS
jgi:GAF domain-containing protein